MTGQGAGARPSHPIRTKYSTGDEAYSNRSVTRFDPGVVINALRTYSLLND